MSRPCSRSSRWSSPPRPPAPMLELMLGSKAPAVAARWLDEQPGHAIPGLIPVAAGRGKLADAALDYLRVQKRKGHEDFIRECLAVGLPRGWRRRSGARCSSGSRTSSRTSMPTRRPTGSGRPARRRSRSSRPPGSRRTTCGRSTLEGRKLNAAAGEGRAGGAGPEHARLRPIRWSPPSRPTPTAASLDAFAWSLFERWLAEGAPSKEKWAMGALGLLGSDATALKLAPMVRAWPGESQHQRAVFGLECLRAIGTDAALMQLNGIAQKLPFKGLKARAAEMMEAIARDRGLSRTELEDRIVPDCDLDERGGRIFDFGPRQFRFALGNDMKPMVRDEAGKLRDDLPKPGAKDDAAKAAAAVEDWKQLKKQVREVAKVQAERLEQAMVTGRRWTPGRLRIPPGPAPADDQPGPPASSGAATTRRAGSSRPSASPRSATTPT